MKSSRTALTSLSLLFCLAAPCLGQSPAPAIQGTNATVQPVPLPQPTPANSNLVTQPPAVTTNRFPVVPPPKTPGTLSGSGIRSAFSGKFVVPGRTLKLPPPEDSGLPPEPEIWDRSMLFGMNMTQGNSDTLRYTLGLEAVRSREEDTTRVRGRSTYGESEGKKDAENASALIRYDRNLSRRVYALGDVDWLTDTIADVDYRILGILSPGLHLIRSEHTVCNFELGAGYLSEKKGSEKEAFVAGRAAGILEHLFNSHALGWCSLEYLPKLSDPDIFFVNAEAGLVSMITRNLQLHVTLEDRYDNAPAEDKTGNDLILTTSLSLKF